jgi:hypothetical protein
MLKRLDTPRGSMDGKKMFGGFPNFCKGYKISPLEFYVKCKNAKINPP